MCEYGILVAFQIQQGNKSEGEIINLALSCKSEIITNRKIITKSKINKNIIKTRMKISLEIKI